MYDGLHTTQLKKVTEEIQHKLKNSTLTTQDRDTINMIDKEFIHIRLQAQKTIHTPSLRRSPWSPPLAQAYLKLQIWLTIKKSIKMKRDENERIENLQEKLIEPLPYIPTQ